MWQIIPVMAALLTSAPLGAAADESYDLRGPAPQKGRVVRDVLKFSMKNADITIDLGNNVKLDGKVDMVSTTEKEEEILGVDGRNITKLRSKIIKDETVRKSKIGGDTQDETEKKALTGEIIFSERVKNGWKHSLEDATPSEKQKKELKDFDEPENDDELYPAEKVKIGQTWDIPAQAFKNVLGSKMTDAKGTGKGKFLRLEKLGGEECAVIETELDIVAKMKQEDSDFDVAIKGNVLTYRSIASGIDLKFTINGHAKFVGTVEEDDMKVKMQFSGKMIGEGSTKIVKK